MKLPIPSLLKKESAEYILALLLRQEKTTAVIIEQRKKESNIVSTHEEYFETNLEDASEEEWLRILDQTISRAEEKLPLSVETHKTVFGVPSHWVEEKHIKKEYLLKLKKTSDALSLTPVGFLEIPEAITHLLQEEEGAPVSAILVEIGKKYLALSLVRGGRIIDTKIGPLTDTPAKTVDTLLRSFVNVEVFPSRIIVFNGGYDEQLVQSFITHHWSKSLPFLHMPQISILPNQFDAKAVVFGAASQMGFEISSSLALSEKDIKTFNASYPHTQTEPESTKVEERENEDTKMPLPVVVPPTPPVPATTSDSPELENFGFMKDEDIALLDETKQTPPQKVESNAEEIRGKEKAVAEDEPEQVKATTKSNFVVHSPHDHEDPVLQEESNIHTPYPETPDESPRKSVFSGLMQMPTTLMSLFASRTSGMNNRKILLLIPLLLLITLGVIAAYVYLVKATITIDVTPREAEQSEEITFATEKDNDFSQGTIQAQTTSVSLTGSSTTTATGKKEDGTKAKGTVTIFNSSELKKQLSEGAVITSSNNLEFVLDKDVTISSASGDIFSGIKSGTAQVAVSAKQIGSEYNLPSNTKFSVGDNSSLAARNEQAFSGGTKKQITVISQQDINKLTAELPKSLSTKARESLKKKISSDDSILTINPDFKPSKKDFSKNVGDEAKSVTLNSSVNYEAVYYANDDLLSYAKTIIADNYDKNLTASEEDIRSTLKNVTEKDKTLYTASLVIKAKLLPNIEEELKKELAGKSFTDAKEVLGRFPQVDNVDISLFPPLPFLPSILPRLDKNISITVTANE